MLFTRFYRVAGHVFEVRADDENAAGVFLLMNNYRPFEEISWPKDYPIFSLEVMEKIEDIQFVEEYRQEDEGQQIVCGKTLSGVPVFEFYNGGVKAGTLVCDDAFHNGTLYYSQNVDLQRYVLNNSLMVLFALASSCKRTALFHAAAVSLEGKGYLFLGRSGTGKSTHASMWLRRFSGAELLNDDNPVIRLEEDGAWIYGSPWSGKTPCYKNARVRLAGIVDLGQAPENRIRSVRGLEAYSALVASISGMRWERKMADGLHETENTLAQEIRMFHLDCTPDENAAKLCYETLASGETNA